MPAWQDGATWRVLDTDFSDGSRFLAVWAAREHHPAGPQRLHYVGIAATIPDPRALLRAVQAHALLASHAPELQHQWTDFTAGFHRIELSAGRVLLTLCVGSVPAMVREQQFVADAILVPTGIDGTGKALWDRWTVKALTRLCRRGTTLELAGTPAPLPGAFAEAGFVFRASATGAGTRHADFDPRWEPGTSRHRWREGAAAASRCAIVGAGLAGAAAAAALSRRGWQVTVLDAASSPAAAASGLPVGLLVPQVARDDNVRVRLSRAGVRLTRAWCHRLLRQDVDWAPSGVRQMAPDGNPGDSLWHASGAWIRPARLVQACLAQPGVRFAGDAHVDRVVWRQGAWHLLDTDGNLMAQAELVLVAAAGGSVPLLERSAAAMAHQHPGLPGFKPMQALGGQVSWGLQTDDDNAAFPGAPVNGNGSFVAHVPVVGGLAWFAGATYEPEASGTPDETGAHRENRQRLARLLPEVARALATRFETGQVGSWRASRCATPDRLPAVGPLHAPGMPPIWLSTAMGSRGLTHAVLCAELLAAQVGGEPLPLEASLARLLAATRPGLLHHL